MVTLVLGLHVGVMIGCALGTLLIGHLVTQRRAPTGNLAWTLAILMVPYVALPLYLVWGGRKMRRLASRKHPIALPQPGPDGPGRLMAHEALLDSRGIPVPCGGNRLVLHTAGEVHYAALIDLIDGAARSVSVCMYSIQPDEIGRDVLARLAQRAKDGLRVRVLLDGVGSIHMRRRMLAPLSVAGGRFAYFMPVFRHPLRGRANLRNHRKIVIADDRVVLGGGANIGAQYMGPARDRRRKDHGTQPERWDDLTFTLEGPAVRQYVELFQSDWHFASGERLRAHGNREADQGAGPGAAAGTARIQVVPSGPDVPGDPLSDALMTLVQAARERVWIVTPYFVPDDAFCRALTLTAHRGVDVRVVVPAHTDHFLPEIAGRSYLREVSRSGGKILADPRMLHAKAVLVDGEVAVLGSANVDMRSLLLNYEAALLVSSAPELDAVERWIEALMRQAHPRRFSTGGLAELGEGVARLLAPQL